ncbi:MAG TPA: universal stress protein [Mycobacteriales bacterium]|nr:universal stress protein [Mycobacteriales bacterium]
MYHRIVVGTDGSSTADCAVDVAGGLALLMGAAIHVVSAYRPARAAAVLAGSGGGLPWFGEEERSDAEAVLEGATARLSRVSLAVSAVSRLGDAADVLLAVAEEVDADLIVVGNRGLTGVRRYLLGGVADRVAHHAPCSVHIVHAC